MPSHRTTSATKHQPPRDFLVQVDYHVSGEWQRIRAADANRAAARAGVEALTRANRIQPGTTAIVYVGEAVESNLWPGTMNPKSVLKLVIEIDEPKAQPTPVTMDHENLQYSSGLRPTTAQRST